MRFYKIINNETKESFLTAQTDKTTLCGIIYQNRPLSNIEELLALANDNATDIDSIATPLLNSTHLKIDLEELIVSSREKSGLFKTTLDDEGFHSMLKTILDSEKDIKPYNDKETLH